MIENLVSRAQMLYSHVVYYSAPLLRADIVRQAPCKCLRMQTQIPRSTQSH